MLYSHSPTPPTSIGTPTIAPTAVRSRSKPRNSSTPAEPMNPTAFRHSPRYRCPRPGTIASPAASNGLLRGRASAGQLGRDPHLRHGADGWSRVEPQWPHVTLEDIA